jgi:hypothetical protein
VCTDLDETWHAWVRNGVLNARQGAGGEAQLTVSGPKQALVAAILQPAAAYQLVTSGPSPWTGTPACSARTPPCLTSLT